MYKPGQVLPTGSLRIEDVLQSPKVLEITDETAFVNKVLLDCNGKSIWFAEDGVRAYVKPEQKTLILRNIPSTTEKEEINKIFVNLNNCPRPKDITSELNNTWFVVFESEADARSANTCLKENQAKFNDEKISSNLKPEHMPKSVIPFSSPSNASAQPFPAYSVPGFSPNGSPSGMPNTIFFPPGANYMAQNAAFVPGAVPLMNPVMYPMLIPRGMPGGWNGPGWQGLMGQGPMQGQPNMGNRVPNGSRVGGPNTKNRNQPRNNVQGRGGQNDNRGFNNRNYFMPHYRNNFRVPIDQFGNPINDFVGRLGTDGEGAAVDAMFNRSGNDGDSMNDQMNSSSRSQNGDDRTDDMSNHDAIAQAHMMGGPMADPQFHHNMEMYYMSGNMMNPVMSMPIIDLNKGRKKNMRGGKMDGTDRDQDGMYGDASDRGKNRVGMNDKRGKDKMDGRGGKGDIKRKNVPAADFNMESDFPTLGNEPVESGAANSNNGSPSSKPVMTGWASAAAGNVTNEAVSQPASKPQINNQNKTVGGNSGAKQTNNKDKGTTPKPDATPPPTNANAFTFGSFDSAPTNANDNNPQANNTASNQDSKNKNSPIDASNNTTHTRDRYSIPPSLPH